MIDVNPLHVVLFGIFWLASEYLIKHAWRAYKEHTGHHLCAVKAAKRTDR